MMRDILLFLMIAMLGGPVFSQNTVGLLSMDYDNLSPGYNLLYSHNQPNTYLINECGEIVHEWTDAEKFVPGNAVYLLENGSLVRCKRDVGSAVNDPIWAGGGGETVEVRTWDNELIADFTLNDSLFRLHHDVALLPNGNILMIAWESFAKEEALQVGRDSNLLDRNSLWALAVLEWSPELDSIVWEWHAWDHLVQDRSAEISSFGVVKNHPERIDINYVRNGNPDWLHTNAIDYNPVLDQIAISIPTFNEFWIIDHSTSREEAASSSGGLADRGGDLLYRWGNPLAYDGADSSFQKLFFQHDVHWISPEADLDDPDFGKIILFNNRLPTLSSSVNVVQTPVDSFSYPLLDSGVFGPEEFATTLLHPTMDEKAYSLSVSSAQVLANGNTLVFSGRWGYAYEVTPSKQVAWEYRVPIQAGKIVAQGEMLGIGDNLTFRMKRYATDFPAFLDRNLTPLRYLENEPDTTFCNSIMSSTYVVPQGITSTVFPNPTACLLRIILGSSKSQQYELLDMNGRLAMKGTLSASVDEIDISGLNNGLYLLRIGESVYHKIIKN